MLIRTNTNPKHMASSAPLMFALVIATACTPSVGFAGDLPSTEEIVAKMIEAEGGAAAKRKIKNRVIKMTLDLGVGGLIAKGVVYAARPGNMHTALEIEGMGTIEEGVTDGVAWALAVMTGPQLKEGGEKAIALREADFDGLLEWKRHFKKIECVSKETREGKEYFKVELTPNEGGVVTSYVDAKTYLPFRTELTLSTAMGDFEMVAYSEDYRSVDGVQYAHKSRIEVMGQTRVLTFQSIEHNVEIPKDQFKLPDDVKALVAQRDAEKSKP